MTTTDILCEGTIGFPISISLKEQSGGRKQLMINETCYNFYDGETAYFHADKNRLAIIMAIEGVKPTPIRQRLKDLLKWGG
jgi:hypothetical protein